MTRAEATLTSDPRVIAQFIGVHKRFGSHEVLRGLSFDVRSSEVTALLGPNGSGKSTALRVLAGLLVPDSGEVRLHGAPLTREAAQRIGSCPQDVALYRDLTVRENLEFFATLHGLAGAPRRRRVDDVIAQLQLAAHADRRVMALSGGWQQRANIAVALVHSPAVLLLDEPTSAVDVQARQELWAVIDRLRQAGTAVLMTTHLLDEAQRLADRVAILHDGRLVRHGRLEELLCEVPGRALAELQVGDADALIRRATELGWPTRRGPASGDSSIRMTCFLPHPMPLREVVDRLDGVDVRSASVTEVRLEHAYLEILRNA